ACASSPRRLVLPLDSELRSEFRADLLGGVPVVRGRALRCDVAADGAALYRAEPRLEPSDFTAVPYFAWDNRTPGEMAVWIAETPSVLEPGAPARLQASASVCSRR